MKDVRKDIENFLLDKKIDRFVIGKIKDTYKWKEEEYDIVELIEEYCSKLVVENRDMKNYLIDTLEYGIDYNTLRSRVEKYMKEV